jgi:hypothetical protein
MTPGLFFVAGRAHWVIRDWNRVCCDKVRVTVRLRAYHNGRVAS